MLIFSIIRTFCSIMKLFEEFLDFPFKILNFIETSTDYNINYVDILIQRDPSLNLSLSYCSFWSLLSFSPNFLCKFFISSSITLFVFWKLFAIFKALSTNSIPEGDLYFNYYSTFYFYFSELNYYEPLLLLVLIHIST